MQNSNLQVAKCYKEQSKALGTFRYIKVDGVEIRENEILVKGNAVSALNDRYDNSTYFDQGEWIEVSEQEFNEAYDNSRLL